MNGIALKFPEKFTKWLQKGKKCDFLWHLIGGSRLEAWIQIMAIKSPPELTTVHRRDKGSADVKAKVLRCRKISSIVIPVSLVAQVADQQILCHEGH